MFIFHLLETYDMFCWILGSILVLETGVLGQVNTNGNDCASVSQVFDEIQSCDVDRASANLESFKDTDNFHGNRIISAVTATCRNFPLMQACIFNITARCSQLDFSLMNVAARDYSRLCNGSQPLDWYLNVMADDFEAKKECVVPLITETLRNCSIEQPPFAVSTGIPVSVWLPWGESLTSSVLSCLMTDLEKTIAEYPTCNVQATDLILVSYSYMSIERQLSTGLSATDDVFKSFQDFVSPPSSTDSWETDWLF